METRALTKKQAARYLLWRQGLLGAHRFTGKSGALRFIRQAGCIQFDPVDVCGKNAELTLQSRVKGFRKQDLYDLLYKDRLLLDQYDKNLCIVPVENWAALARERRKNADWSRSREQVEPVRALVREEILRRGALCSADLPMNEVVSWYWSDTRLARAALDTMYFDGELVVHHRKNAVKYYDLAQRVLPPEIFGAPDPFDSEESCLAWRVARRIGAVGLLRNAPSDAFLNLPGMQAAGRDAAFSRLIEQGRLARIVVEGESKPFYCLSEALPDVDFILTNPRLKRRCEALAPLDCFLWDRKLISAIFGFDYKWEIYTPDPLRKYGHYVLPLIEGDRFIGRVEAICDRKKSVMTAPRLWYEQGVKRDARLGEAVNGCLARLAAFNGCALDLSGQTVYKG